MQDRDAAKPVRFVVANDPAIVKDLVAKCRVSRQSDLQDLLGHGVIVIPERENVKA